MLKEKLNAFIIFLNFHAAVKDFRPEIVLTKSAGQG